MSQVLHEKMAICAAATTADRSDVVPYRRLVNMCGDNLRRVVLHRCGVTEGHVGGVRPDRRAGKRGARVPRRARAGGPEHVGRVLRVVGGAVGAAREMRACSVPLGGSVRPGPLMGPLGLGLLPGRRCGVVDLSSSCASRKRRVAGRILLGLRRAHGDSAVEC